MHEPALRAAAFGSDPLPDPAVLRGAGSPRERLLAAIVLGAQGRYAAAAALLDVLRHDPDPVTASLAASTLGAHRRQLGGHRQARALDGEAFAKVAALESGAGAGGLGVAGVRAAALEVGLGTGAGGRGLGGEAFARVAALEGDPDPEGLGAGSAARETGPEGLTAARTRTAAGPGPGGLDASGAKVAPPGTGPDSEWLAAARVKAAASEPGPDSGGLATSGAKVAPSGTAPDPEGSAAARARAAAPELSPGSGRSGVAAAEAATPGTGPAPTAPGQPGAKTLPNAAHPESGPDPDGLDAAGARADALLGLAADNLALGRLRAARRLAARAAEQHAGWRACVRGGWVGAEIELAAGQGAAAVPHAERAFETALARGARRHAVKSGIVLAVAVRAAGRPDHREISDGLVGNALATAEECELLSLLWPAALVAADLRPGHAEEYRFRVAQVLHAVLRSADPCGRRIAGESPWVPDPGG
ncbi:hypothetical protein [Amycolatopsis sp. cg9]|uniref:hypothetical protein n=1 Tax=Amycolatopsis sp. cg9 TaxID=3238801 RepID=UPI0035258FEA